MLLDLRKRLHNVEEFFFQLKKVMSFDPLIKKKKTKSITARKIKTNLRPVSASPVSTRSGKSRQKPYYCESDKRTIIQEKSLYVLPKNPSSLDIEDDEDKYDQLKYKTHTCSDVPDTATGVGHSMLDKEEVIRCGFCHATNMSWRLKCNFCGCGRIHDKPRLKSYIETLLNLKPHLTTREFGQHVIKYANMDSFAMKTEKEFKSAMSIRNKVGIKMLLNMIENLHLKISHFVFKAWKKLFIERRKAAVKFNFIINKTKKNHLLGLYYCYWTMTHRSEVFQRNEKVQIFRSFAKKRTMHRTFVAFWRYRALESNSISEQATEGSTTTDDDSSYKVVLLLAIKSRLPTLERLDLKVRNSIQNILVLQKMFPETAGALVESLQLESIIHEVQSLSLTSSKKEKANIISSALSREKTSVANFIKYREDDCRTVCKRVSHTLPWEIILQWHNYHLLLFHDKNNVSLFTLQDITQPLKWLPYLINLLELYYPESDAKSKCDIDDESLLESQVATYIDLMHTHADLPTSIFSLEDFMTHDFEKTYLFLCFLFNSLAVPEQFNKLPQDHEVITETSTSLCNFAELNDTVARISSIPEEIMESEVKYLKQSQSVISFYIDKYSELDTADTKLREVLQLHRDTVHDWNVRDVYNRIERKPIAALKELSKQMSRSFAEIKEPERLKDLLQSGGDDNSSEDDNNKNIEFSQLQQLLCANSLLLKSLYEKCKDSSSHQITQLGVLKLLQELGVTGSCGILQRPQIDTIFEKAEICTEIISNEDTQVVGVNPEEELQSFEFVEIIVRIAVERNNLVPQDSQCLSVSQCVRGFLRDLQDASNSLCPSTSFSIEDSKVKAVLGRYYENLEKEFYAYAALGACNQKCAGRFSYKYLYASQFIQFVKDKQIVAEKLTTDDCLEIFRLVPQGQFKGDVKFDETWIFQEFLEGMAVVATYRDQNPYASLSTKLENLLYKIM